MMSAALIQQQRQAVWAEAETWLRTPWRHRQALKGVGVDCGRLLIEVYAGAGVIERFVPEPYAADWCLNQTEERFLAVVERFGVEIDEAEAWLGDTVVFKNGLTFSHGAILGEGSQMIHALRRLSNGGVQFGDWRAEEEFRIAPKRFYSPSAWRAG